jgi:hypothetical protein
MVLIANACINIESIVFGFPALSIVGLVLALVSRVIASWTVMLFALSAPLVCATGALVIATFRMGPDDAAIPIASLLVVYGVLITPLAIVAARRIGAWQIDPASQPAAPWRYSLKALLLLMTAVCIATAIVSFVLKFSLDFPIVFASYGLVTVRLACFIAWRFLATQQRRVRR